MQSKATTVEAYLAELPQERKMAFSELHRVIKKNLPKGFKEVMSYGMIGYCVPHTIYPAGYRCAPKQPLPFMGIASQKHFIAVYSMAVYADPKLFKWFTEAYAKSGAGKLDMGKSCIRFKKFEKIPFKLMGELASKVSVAEWIALYENSFLKKN